MNKLRFWPLLLLLSISLQAQQIDKIGKKGGITTSGGLSFTNQFYHVNGESNVSTPPYSYMVSGNVNINAYGWALPFSIVYTNRKFVTGQPGNVIGVSPTYKNLTLHAGVRNLTFSPYTLAGHKFTGGGAEYNWKEKGLAVKMMCGQLLHAVEYDPLDTRKVPTYARNAAGVMLDYNKEGNSVQFIVFYAKDQEGSISAFPDSVSTYHNASPQENMVYSLGFKKQLNKVVSLRAEGAVSAWVKNVNGYDVKQGEPFIKPLFAIENPNKAYYYNAYKMGADFNLKVATLGLGYDHVDPNFYTMGAYNVADDYENYTLNATTGVWQNKIRLSATGGLQKNDLNDQKETNNNQFTSSFSISITPTERWQISAAYSGFNSITRIKQVEEQFLDNEKNYYYLDTANVIQVTNTLNASVSYVLFNSDRISHNLSTNGSVQKADNGQGDQRLGTEMYNGGLSYNVLWKESGISLAVFTSANQNNYQTGNSKYLGYGASAGARAFDKKLGISLAANAANNYEQEVNTAVLYSLVNTYAYTLGKSHNLSLNFRYAGRQKKADATHSLFNSNVNELFVDFTYAYNFSLSKLNKKE